jgi:hypothetical protein
MDSHVGLMNLLSAVNPQMVYTVLLQLIHEGLDKLRHAESQLANLVIRNVGCFSEVMGTPSMEYIATRQ